MPECLPPKNENIFREKNYSVIMRRSKCMIYPIFIFHYRLPLKSWFRVSSQINEKSMCVIKWLLPTYFSSANTGRVYRQDKKNLNLLFWWRLKASKKRSLFLNINTFRSLSIFQYSTFQQCSCNAESWIKLLEVEIRWLIFFLRFFIILERGLNNLRYTKIS